MNSLLALYLFVVAMIGYTILVAYNNYIIREELKHNLALAEAREQAASVPYPPKSNREDG